MTSITDDNYIKILTIYQQFIKILIVQWLMQVCIFRLNVNKGMCYNTKDR